MKPKVDDTKQSIADAVVTPKQKYFVPVYGVGEVEGDSPEDAAAKARDLREQLANEKRAAAQADAETPAPEQTDTPPETPSPDDTSKDDKTNSKTKTEVGDAK